MDHMQRFLRFTRAGYSCLQLADAMDTRTLRLMAESRVTSYLKSMQVMQVVRSEEETLSETSELVVGTGDFK